MTNQIVETVTAGNRLYKIFTDMAGYYSQPIEGTSHYRVKYRVLRGGKEYGPEFYLSANPTFTYAFGQTETFSGHVSKGYTTVDDARAAITKHSTEKPYANPRERNASNASLGV